MNGPIPQLVLCRKEAGASGLLEVPELPLCSLHPRGTGEGPESSMGPRKSFSSKAPSPVPPFPSRAAPPSLAGLKPPWWACGEAKEEGALRGLPLPGSPKGSGVPTAGTQE